MKDICRRCEEEIEQAIESKMEIEGLRSFVDNMLQYALLGIQLMWTQDVTKALDECRVSGVGAKANCHYSRTF